MFESLKQLAQNAIDLDSSAIAVEVYKTPDIISVILKGNRIDQLSQGLDATGKVIGYYSAFTEFISNGDISSFDGLSFAKIEGEPYNFVDTSEFFSSFGVRIEKDGFIIVADDQKEDGPLSAKYKNLLGLDNESRNQLVEAMRPVFLEFVRESLLKEVS